MEFWTSISEAVSQLGEGSLVATFLVLAGLALIGLILRSALGEWEAREALERKYTMLLEQVAEGVLLAKAPSGPIIAANPAAAGLTGYAVDELLHLDLSALFPFDAPAQWLKEVRALGRVNMTGVALHRKHGTTAPVDMDAVCLRQGREKVVQIVLRPTDTTPSKEVGTGSQTVDIYASPFSAPPFPTLARIPEPAPPSPPPTATGQALPTRGEPPLLREVATVVSQHFGISLEELLGTRHIPQLTLARRIAMYLALEVAGAKAHEAGHFLGGRSEVAVIYGARCLADALEQDPNLRRQVEELAARIRRSERKGAVAQA